MFLLKHLSRFLFQFSLFLKPASMLLRCLGFKTEIPNRGELKHKMKYCLLEQEVWKWWGVRRLTLSAIKRCHQGPRYFPYSPSLSPPRPSILGHFHGWRWQSLSQTSPPYTTIPKTRKSLPHLYLFLNWKVEQIVQVRRWCYSSYCNRRTFMNEKVL